MIGNKEEAICETCGRKYKKRIVAKKGRRGHMLRKCNSKTCSKKCSRERVRFFNKNRRKIAQNKYITQDLNSKMNKQETR